VPEPVSRGWTGSDWHIADEANDTWQKPEGRHGPVELPVGDGCLIDAEPLGDLALEQAQVEPALAQVISYRCKDLRVRTG
jgi:hypothetical protein